MMFFVRKLAKKIILHTIILGVGGSIIVEVPRLILLQCCKVLKLKAPFSPCFKGFFSKVNFCGATVKDSITFLLFFF